ncbi:hypothetical protein K9U34_04000 [Lawsonia intracellularis]|uniref:NA n=1 Tax=Lawsonia intracellularis (strain PHE/MN1-00) TaxID=363253 RepID=Q1MPY6_LAWIP|nr:hypothetical protein [Lawsonia intracellularis]AGC50311.1 hypothetical protein LAW_00916 [Lawsonia intracellularis N343]KAA0204334.1 hypothetical protein C4K43_04960 [Lawsonia intracellularis]MBZ3892756.1 hypothetical protein [Lawsonia intracellularis]RBN33081.1 hypothetical protein DR194_01425 [Lawsonia intracellularis]CAJ54941.1 NA [Lawsonia intracellularis PHE/MN1-00]
MSIRINYANELQRQEETKKISKPIQGSSFENLLSEELTATSTINPSKVLSGKSSNVEQMLLMGLAKPKAAKFVKDATLTSITEQASILLNSWDEYSSALEEGITTRGAWEKLTTIENHTKNLQGNLANIQPPNSDLESMVNELSIMAVVEKAKINRGDYML